ncbi:MAG: sigma-70 family RNA polymerase sigma factor [Actinomycetota bacterium]|nr:sigma-70 family RNA polymerase sigma factor [Actinomycetota bacterium]
MSSQTDRSPDPADEAAFQRALVAARAGQAPGFEWLWRRFSRQVTAFARLRGSDDPEGLANDVFTGAFQQIAKFEGSSTSFVAFLFAIARNKVIDELRRWGSTVRPPLGSAWPVWR